MELLRIKKNQFHLVLVYCSMLYILVASPSDEHVAIPAVIESVRGGENHATMSTPSLLRLADVSYLF